MGWGLLLVAGSADAATYYVATTGEDSRSCSEAQNVATPRRTPEAGITCLASGDTLLLRGGVYELLTYNVYPPAGTSWSTATTIASAPGETATIRPPGNGEAFAIWNTRYVILDRLVFDGSNHTGDAFLSEISCDYDRTLNQWIPETCADHIRIQNSEFKNAGGTALGSGKGSENNLTQGHHEFINNSVHDSNRWTECDQAEAFYMGTDSDLYVGNVFHDNEGTAI